MKIAVILFCILLTSFQSGKSVLHKGVDPKILTFEQVEAHVQNTNALKDKKKLTKQNYEGMTAWGSLTAYWGKSDLAMAESVYNAELGFTNITVYYYENEICRIVTKKHLANWGDYERDHGHEEFDESKVTYTDELYDYTFGKETIFRIWEKDKMIPSKLDQTRLDDELIYLDLMKKFIEETDN